MAEDDIIGFIEAITPQGVAGWALRPGDAGPLGLVLVIDGEAVAPVACDRPRLDVWTQRTDLHGLCGHGPRVGFLAAIPPVFFDWAVHRLDLVTAAGGSAGLVVIGQPPDGGARFQLARHEVVARARVVEAGAAVHGWVFVRDRMTGELRVGNEVAVEADNGWHGRVVADGMRPDVALDQGCGAACGFQLVVPEAALTEGRGLLRFSVLPEGLPFAQGEIEVLREPEPQDFGDDPDDGRLRFSGFARRALFGIGARLAAWRAALEEPGGAVAGEGGYGSDLERTVGLEFDRAYYLDAYRDVQAEGLDPVLHYVRRGWHEGRKPAPWFDTAYYLTANPDVRAAGVNPFWHFLVVGRREGRAAQRAGGQRREVIEGLATAEELGGERPASAMRLLPAYLARRLGQVGEGAVVLAVTAAGGERTVLLAAEQAAFAGAGWHYLLLEPAAGGMLRVVLDGSGLGVARREDLAVAIKARGGGARAMVVHGVTGHDLDGLAMLRRAAGEGRDFLWLHDFSALCPGGTLLRNDVVFCGAPAEGSNACLVCVHGEGRGAHLAGMRRLLAAGDFTVVAPSAAAAAMWQRMTPFPALPVVEIAPLRLEERAIRVGLVAPERLGSPAHPVRVAFGGGDWAGFRALLERVGRLGCYRFFHVPDRAMTEQDGGRTEALGDGVLEEVLAAAGIDLLLVMPAGPEVFSRGALAGIAAGADVVTLADSLHAADVVMASGRGVVAADAAALIGFFESLRAIAYARLRAEAGAVGGGLVVAGTTAGVLA